MSDNEVFYWFLRIMPIITTLLLWAYLGWDIPAARLFVPVPIAMAVWLDIYPLWTLFVVLGFGALDFTINMAGDELEEDSLNNVSAEPNKVVAQKFNLPYKKFGDK